MLKDIDQLFNAVERWTTAHPVIGFIVMGYMGGLVAAIRMYERVGMQFSVFGFIARGLVKGILGSFVAVLMFFAWRAQGYALDWGMLIAGLCGVFGTDILEMVMVLGWDFLRKRAGLEPKVMPPSGQRDPGSTEKTNG